MELSFTRVDLLQVGQLNRKTLDVLPVANKQQQKIVVGDESGSIICFSIKRGDVVVSIDVSG